MLLGNSAGVLTLLLALAFPVVYGALDFIKNKRKNIISLFGCLNVLLTGGFALYKLSGIWFAVKEAAFPLLIGIFIFISAYMKKSCFEYLIHHSHIFKWDLIVERVEEAKSGQKLKSLLKKSTILFSLSFFISAGLNFILALYIFSAKGLPEGLSSEQKDLILNKNIADMTWMGFVVIGLPMTIFAIGIFWSFVKQLTKITQLNMEQILTTTATKPGSRS